MLKSQIKLKLNNILIYYRWISTINISKAAISKLKPKESAISTILRLWMHTLKNKKCY